MTALRLGLRGLRNAPWFAASIIVVLTVGMTLALVAFAVVERTLFRSLPYDRPGQLFVLRADHTATQRSELAPVSLREIDAWVAAAPELRPTIVGARSVDYPIDGVPAVMATVDRAVLDVLGVRPLLGGFSPEDFERAPDSSDPRSIRPVLLSHRLWQSLAGGDPLAVGQTRVVSERGGRLFGYRIAGVLPEGFVFPLDLPGGQPDFLMPLARAAEIDTRREFHLVFRIAAGVDLAGVRARLERATADLARSKPPADPRDHRAEIRLHAPFDRVGLEPLGDWIAARQRTSSRFLFWTALGLLAVACINAAGLAAARNVERQAQLLVCRALGASVRDLAKLQFVEVGALASVAAALAFVLANAVPVQTLSVLPESMVFGAPPTVAGRAAIATVLFTVCSVVAVSVWPLVVAARFGQSNMATRRRPSGVVIALQSAFGFAFVIAGVLTVASLGAVLSNDAGYERDRMILLEGSVRRYMSRDDARQQLEDSVALLRRLPVVQRVALSTIQSTFLRPTATAIAVIPQGWSKAAEQATVRQVSDEFFEVMGLRLMEGRWPEPGEWTGSSTAIVSQAAARTFWPDGTAIGRSLSTNQTTPARVVIGVVADTRFVGLDVEPTQDVYLPNAIAPGRTGLLYHIRTAQPAEAVLPVIVRELSAAGMRVDRATTHSRGLFDTIKDRALPAWLFGSLAAGALVILAIGVGGLLAMASAQRTREVGIRLALGSTRSQVVTMMMSRPLTALALGLVLGGIGSWWLVTFLDAQLYGVGSHHPGLWALAALLIAAVGCGAGVVPAIRAARLNPLDAIRAD